MSARRIFLIYVSPEDALAGIHVAPPDVVSDDHLSSEDLLQVGRGSSDIANLMIQNTMINWHLRYLL
jgi:hypothetical protein